MFTKISENSFVNQIILAFTVAFIFAVGLLNLPLTINFIQDTKTYLVLLFVLILIAGYSLHSFKKKRLSLVISPFFWPLVFFTIAMAISTFIAPAYPVENLLGAGGIYLSFALISLIGGVILPKSSQAIIIKVLALVGLINTLGACLQLVGFGPAQLFNTLLKLDLPKDINFSLVGGSLISLQITILGLTGLIWQSIKNKKVSMFAAVVMPILLIGIGLYSWAIRPSGSSPIRLPSLLASWSITLDTIRAPKTALIGFGPESFINSYRQFKPTWVNGTADWSLVFNTATNLPLTLLATTGFLGLLSWLLLAYKVIRFSLKEFKNNQSTGLVAPLFLSFVANLVLPGNVVLFFIQAVMLAAFIASKKEQLPSLEVGNLNLFIASPNRVADAFSGKNQIKDTNLPAYFFSLLLLAGSIFGVYGLMKSYQSQNLLLQANQAAQNNDAAKVYELQQKATVINPYFDINRRSYALTNIMIAAALANKTDITDEEKEQVNLLLQQAVREARAATVLDPSDSQNWQVLANVYSNMIGVVQDADQWSTQAYVNAIQTFPTDPNLRISLGGVLLATKQLDQAISVFAQAVDIKPDFANSQYNLAVALRQAGRLEESKSAYQKTLALVDSSSEDFIKLTQEVEALDQEIEKLPKKTTSGDGQTLEQTKGETITEQQINTDQTDVVSPQPEQDIILPDVTQQNEEQAN